ncbi:PAS domain-containing sensor histidine kinase [Flavobacterium sp. IR1]|nr:PAS domain-containing sensor histidine kinase [Flavobacterium sp. IR1]
MKLIENKELFQAILNSSPNGITILQSVYNEKDKTVNFLVMLLNSAALHFIDDRCYENKSYSEVFSMMKETDVEEKFTEVLKTGVTVSFENSFIAHDKKYWFQFTVVKQADLLVVTTEDITALKQAEITLYNALATAEKQKRFYDSITNNTPDLVYVFDLSYIFTYANKALLTMWGKSAEDSIGRGLRENGYEEWHALMHEREIDEVVATKKTVRGTVSFPHAELGDRVYDYILAPVLNEEGEVEAIAGTTRDITEIKQAEKRIQQSETRFRSMIEQAPIAMLLSKGEDVIIESINNPMLQFINKKTAKEVLGKKAFDTLPELADQQILQTVVQVQKTGIPYRGYEQPVDLLVNNKIERRYFNFSYDSIKDAEESSAVLHMAMDVTEQVLARWKLEDSESRLKSVIDQTPAPTLVLMGKDLVIEQINKHMLQMIGRDKEIIGKALIDVLPELEGQYVWKQVQNVYNKGIPFYQSEVLVQHKRTGVSVDYYYNLAYRPLIQNGQIVGMIQVAIDVTEHVMARKKLEESEKRFRALVNASSDAVYRMNADFTGLRNLEDQGFDTNQQQAPSVNWIDKYIHPDDRKQAVHFIEASIENKKIFELEHRVLNADGTFTWNFSRAVPIVDDQNNVIEWFGTCTDIHEERTITEKLESLVADRTKELQRSNEDLQQFAHVASHDLKEPVRKIKTFTSRLQDHLSEQLDEVATRYIERIHVATDRMFNMIDGVLAYSKINADLQKPTVVDLNEVIKNIETDLEVSLQRTGGKIDYDDLATLEGASVLIYQLFYNLINNSLKFAKTNVPPEIKIVSEIKEEKNKRFAVITLTDNGIGFDPDMAERIFETFTRLNSKDNYEGTGLGLALCKKIVERHEGKITATGIINEGAVFSITLPLQQKENNI